MAKHTESLRWVSLYSSLEDLTNYYNAHLHDLPLPKLAPRLRDLVQRVGPFNAMMDVKERMDRLEFELEPERGKIRPAYCPRCQANDMKFLMDHGTWNEYICNRCHYRMAFQLDRTPRVVLSKDMVRDEP